MGWQECLSVQVTHSNARGGDTEPAVWRGGPTPGFSVASDGCERAAPRGPSLRGKIILHVDLPSQVWGRKGTVTEAVL